MTFWDAEGKENDLVKLQGKKRSMVILSAFHFLLWLYMTCSQVTSPCLGCDEKSSNHSSQREVLGS